MPRYGIDRICPELARQLPSLTAHQRLQLQPHIDHLTELWRATSEIQDKRIGKGGYWTGRLVMTGLRHNIGRAFESLADQIIWRNEPEAAPVEKVISGFISDAGDFPDPEAIPDLFTAAAETAPALRRRTRP